MNGPYFSVLVPTRGRPRLAAECVRSILAQAHRSFELLLLDQTPGTETRDAALAAAAGSPRFRHVPVEGTGRSRALNAGIPLARGAWIVMTDDDCEPEDGWLEALDAETRKAGPRAAIVARVRPGPVGPGQAVPPATIEDPEARDYAGRVDRDLVYPNFAVPREAFEAIGRFDLRLGVGTPIPGGEDNDFGYRLLRAGWRILYRPGPAVIHRAWRSPEERAALKRAYGIGQGAFYRKHLGRDPFIAWRFARDLFRSARAAGGAFVRGRSGEGRGHLAYFAGLLEGARRLGRLPPTGVVLEHDLDRAGGLAPEAREAAMAYVVLRRGTALVGRMVLDERSPRDDGAFLARARQAAAPLPLPTEPRCTEPVSVVIATRDRPEDLRACLAALARLDPGPEEIVVADSASADPGAIERAARAARATYVRLDRAGLSLARNAGAAAATGTILAFLDDDCRVDAGWLAALRGGFAEPAVEAVTGQLLPSEIETPAQVLFLRYSHMDRRGFAPRRFSRDSRESRYWPVDAWRMGSGGNLAARAATFRRLGGFRTSLGLGTPAKGGEDLFFLWQVIHGGGTVVYRPDAMAWHRHHRDLDALRRVMRGYGAGHAAYLREARRAGASHATVALYRLSYAYDRAKRWGRASLGAAGYPPWMPLTEFRGSLEGGS